VIPITALGDILRHRGNRMKRTRISDGPAHLASLQCIFLAPMSLGTWGSALSNYILPLAAAAAVITFILWRQLRREFLQRTAELDRSRDLLQQRERERDLAQEELFRRLYEERELNKNKVQFQSQLAEYEKYAALAQLALGAAHEINNPLLGILSHLELELNATTDPEQRNEIEQCIAGAKRISSTLRGLVNYARPGPLLLSKISLYRLVAETIAFIEHQPMLRAKHLANDIPPDLPHIRADANQLSQVLMNLLLNAAEATLEGGKIVIAASKLTYVDMIEIRVTDTGGGIPADILPHVFEPFFTTKRGRGTGLGLSICQAYVRSHNGEIRVDSVVNHGTTVTLTLPTRQEESNETQKEESEIVM
jgi:signal transduction histidine kinase